MTIAKKLYGSFGAAMAITIVMGFIAVTNIAKLGSNIEDLGHRSTRCLYLNGDTDKLSSDTLAQVRGILLRAHMHDPATMQKYYDLALADIGRIRKEDAEFLELSKSPELAEKIKTGIDDKLESLTQAINEAYALDAKGDLAGADELYRDKLSALAKTISETADSIYQSQEQLINKSADKAFEAVTPARNLSLLMIALSIGVGIFAMWIVSGINTTLRSSLLELSDGADQTSNAASQISGSSQSLAQGASEQAASLEETSASAEEINSMARKNTDNSRATADLLAQSQQKVAQANHHLEEMVVSMDQINESSGKISKIIKVIDEIAFQTNILALNAAVEAARAGEAGMGFAVVADEVRSLAQRSAQAAKDTAVLIEDSIAKSNEGKGKVDQVALAIQAVTEDSARVKVMIDEVSLGSQEQTKGIEQIGRAISQMEQVTQTTAANAEESAAAAEQLNAQSEALKDVVGRLSVLVGAAEQGMGSLRRSPPARASAARKPAPSPAKRPPSMASQPKSSFVGAANSKKKTSMEDEFPMEESFQSF